MNKIETRFTLISLIRLLLMVSLLSMTSMAFASTVIRADLPQVAQKSQLVFEGQVISQQVRYAANGDPFTYFTFQILDVIKGSYTASTIELAYMGGMNANGDILQVTDMQMPAVGEHGIYFVESLTRQQVHPLYGWQQGHYLVIPSQAGASARVVPVTNGANVFSRARVVAPSLGQFKQQIRALAGAPQ